jgi:type II secretory pathway component PulF
MPVYKWEAKARDGQEKKGEMEADNEAAVNDFLKRQQTIGCRTQQFDIRQAFNYARKDLAVRDRVIHHQDPYFVVCHMRLRFIP